MSDDRDKLFEEHARILQMATAELKKANDLAKPGQRMSNPHRVLNQANFMIGGIIMTALETPAGSERDAAFAAEVSQAQLEPRKDKNEWPLLMTGIRVAARELGLNWQERTGPAKAAE